MVGHAVPLTTCKLLAVIFSCPLLLNEIYINVKNIIISGLYLFIFHYLFRDTCMKSSTITAIKRLENVGV